jgi:hypothetical protein
MSYPSLNPNQRYTWTIYNVNFLMVSYWYKYDQSKKHVKH